MLKEKNNIILLILAVSALILHLITSLLPGFSIDVGDWLAWAVRLNEVGISNFYSDDIFTNYTPGYLYILSVFGLIYDIFNLSVNQFYFLQKFITVISEIALGFLVYKFALHHRVPFKIAVLAASLIWFNPALIFNTSVWGQIDALLALFMIISIFLLSKGNLILSSVFLGLSFLIKPQTIGIFPVFFFFIIENFQINRLFKLTIPALVTVLLLSVPFFPDNPITGIINLTKNMAGDYNYTSLFAYNFWGLYGFWADDKALGLFNISLNLWGYIFLLIYWGSISFAFYKKKISLFSLSALATLSFFFLPTKVHERYLFPAIPFLVISGILLKSRLILILSGILSFIHLINLYFVYVYYNEVFFKLPKVLYHPVLFPLIENNHTLLSLISCIIFLVLTYLIINFSHDRKDIKS